jgi:electron transfer DM13
MSFEFIKSGSFAVVAVALGTAPSFAGPIRGVNGHTASGNATIEGGQVELGADFRFDGGPDVYVAVKQGGKIQLLGKLRENSGAQSYALPAGGAEAEEILLFCKQFNVTLGKAPVN